MKITREQASKLLVESESFRTIVLNKIYGDNKSVFVRDMIDHAERVMYERRGDNVSPKIAAIKAVREYAVHHSERFNKEYPNVLLGNKDQGDCPLTFAKLFVESEMGIK